MQAQINLAKIYEGLGLALSANGDNRGAFENFEKAVSLHESEVESDKLNVITRAELANLYFKIAKFFELRDRQSARNWYQKSLDVWNNLREQNALRKIDGKNYEETSAALTRLKVSS